MYYYSASNAGFCDSDTINLPEDAVEISEKLRNEMFEGQAMGFEIVPDAKGLPCLAKPATPTTEELNAGVSVQREDAYRAEADPLYFMVQRGEVEEQLWLDKVAEIRARFPKY